MRISDWSSDVCSSDLKAEACAQEMTDALGVPVHRAETIAKLAGESDIVVTTTPATAPLIEAQHLRPGMTVIAMGSDAPTKNEESGGAASRERGGRHV